MARIRVTQELAAPPPAVWADVSDLASHVEWMADADTITFVTDSRSGVGTAFDCLTRVGPVRLTDRMEVTSWVEGHEIGIRHRGTVTGEGRFRLEPLAGGRTRFVWEEQLRFPWWMGGPLGGLVGAQVLRWIWRRNLRRLAHRFA